MWVRRQVRRVRTGMVRLVDWLGDLVAARCTPRVQRRIGVIMCLLSLPLFIVGFFVKEPFLVYQMSAAALLFGGLSTVVAAVPSEEHGEVRRAGAGLRRRSRPR